MYGNIISYKHTCCQALITFIFTNVWLHLEFLNAEFPFVEQRISAFWVWKIRFNSHIEVDHILSGVSISIQFRLDTATLAFAKLIEKHWPQNVYSTSPHIPCADFQIYNMKNL